MSTFSPHRAASPLKKVPLFTLPPRVKESAISPLSFTRGTPPRKRPSRQEPLLFAYIEKGVTGQRAKALKKANPTCISEAERVPYSPVFVGSDPNQKPRLFLLSFLSPPPSSLNAPRQKCLFSEREGVSKKGRGEILHLRFFCLFPVASSYVSLSSFSSSFFFSFLVKKRSRVGEEGKRKEGGRPSLPFPSLFSGS